MGNGGAERRYHDPDAVVPISHTRDTVGPMARTVADVALLDGVITGDTSLPAVTLAGLRIGIPGPFWTDLEHAVENAARAALKRLEAAGVVLVPVGMDAVMDLNRAVGGPVAFHEALTDVPAWLVANDAPVKTVAEVAARIGSPDVRGIYDLMQTDPLAAAYPDALNVARPALQRHYEDTFSKYGIEALLFPTTILAAVPLDELEGSSTVSINGGAPIDEMNAYLRNTDPASNAGIPGLSLPAGLTHDGLPVGLELDGPVGSDRRLLAIGIAFEQVLGTLPAPVI